MAYEIIFYEKENEESEIWNFLEEFVLFHSFRKKTQKTPKREIIKAKMERDDYLKRKESGKL